jgi:spore germination protein YaaH
MLIGSLTLVLFPALFSQAIEALYYCVNEEESVRSFMANVDFVDILGPQVYSVDANGVISGSLDSRVLVLARAHKIKIMPLVIQPGFDQPMFHKLLHDPKAQQRAIRSMVTLCKENAYYGIQFDFENIHITDRDEYTAFYKDAAFALHKEGYAISMAVVPRISDDPGPTSYHKWIYEYWRGVYDYNAIADVSDFISFMTYDQHTHLTPPGPVAGMPWMIQCIEFVLRSGVPVEKISIGFPFYSTHWFPFAKDEQIQHAAGRSLSYPDAKGIADRNDAVIRWDDTEKVNYTVYCNQGLNEHLYFEDAKAMNAKLELMKKYKFRGFSIWRLGNEDPDVWKVLPRASHALPK